MRRILASSLLLSVSLLPAAAFAATPEATGSNAVQHVRVSTGVIAPSLISSATVAPPNGALAKAVPTPAQVGLDVTIDARGQAQDVHVRQSLTPEWDASVIAAVRQFRFRPATLDGQPYAVQVHLLVDIQR